MASPEAARPSAINPQTTQTASAPNGNTLTQTVQTVDPSAPSLSQTHIYTDSYNSNDWVSSSGDDGLALSYGDDATGQERSHNPSLARFRQPDPSQTDGVRVYVYAGDAPLDYTDPTGFGLCEVPLLGGVVCGSGQVLHGAWQFVAGDDFQTLSSNTGIGPRRSPWWIWRAMRRC